MSAFDGAIRALHRDRTLSSVCTWAPGWDRAWPRAMAVDLELMTASLSMEPVALRCIDAAPREEAFVLDRPAVVADKRQVSFAIADIPAGLRKGDMVDIGADPYTVAAEPERDIERVTWFATLADRA